jgi:hypothetical protein
MIEYNDDYPTCSSTFATLCIYPGNISPDEITVRLQLAPSSIQIAEARPPGIKDRPAGWFFTSKCVVESRDIRRHLDWILNQIADKSCVFNDLRDHGVDARISCYWMTASGHGGPSLWPTQMVILASLGLEIEFDFYS